MTRTTTNALLTVAGWLALSAAAPAQVVTTLKDFTGGTLTTPGDGGIPTGSLLLYGGNFYGMTAAGGNFGDGVIFRMAVDGTAYTVLRTFRGGSNDGRNPHGSLIPFGGFLYGMTEAGGSTGNGIIFRTNLDGTGFVIVHSFAGGPTDGSAPLGTLTLSGSTFYGTTVSGGSVPNANGLYQFGTIFKMNTDGTGYTVL
ncbi:MAG TPA: choice-of-anchor tandem repeat GloVer-containing protein, partial [Gemmataceae bacterium]|nr:choice-of-anchor tandem repeat GloVer-containing protein [Gemmataceae bacterium]